jgi:hypothetical protein
MRERTLVGLSGSGEPGIERRVEVHQVKAPVGQPRDGRG